MKPAILNATLKHTKITMHGEDHSNIDNKYYESLKFKEGELLFVEHSNNACEIKPEDEHLFKAYAKGSEWVFYTQKKLGNPNVICFDTRAEQGYLNAFEEKNLLTAADKLAGDDTAYMRFYLDSVLKTMKALSNNKPVFESEYFDRSFNILDGQLKAVIALLKIKKAKGIDTDVLGMPLDGLLPGLAYTLATNLRRIASVSVDMGLSKALVEFANRGATDIHIFCGKNHLVRMAHMLPLSNLKITGITKELELLADIEMQGDPEIDRQIVALN